MTKLLSRYLLLQIATGVGLAFAVILLMVMLVDFVELNRIIATKADVSAFEVAGLVLLRAPTLMEATLPFVFLFGAMWGMFRMNRRSELVVLRASGMSAWRFIWPGVLFSIVAGAAAAAAINPAAARLHAEAEARKNRILSPGELDVALSEGGVWLREGRQDGQFVMRAGTSKLGGRELSDITILVFEHDLDGRAEFARRYDAATAELRSGFWQLSEAWEVAPDSEPIRHGNLALPTELDPADILETEAGPRTLGFWDLPRQAKLLREAGFSAVLYDLRWHRLAATPLILAAMTVVASAACLRLPRRGGAFQLVVVAAAAGFALYFTDSLLAALGQGGALPIFMAGWTAPTLAMLMGLLLISTIEDG